MDSAEKNINTEISSSENIEPTLVLEKTLKGVSNKREETYSFKVKKRIKAGKAVAISIPIDTGGSREASHTANASGEISEGTNSALTAIFNEKTRKITNEKLELKPEVAKNLALLDVYYKKESKFAEGGHADLYTGFDKILNRYIALKALKSEWRNSTEIVSSFLSEAKITAQLDHPCIIPLYNLTSGKEKNELYLAMKLINGKTLREVIIGHVREAMSYLPSKSALRKYERVARKELLEIFIKVCDAVYFAHKNNVIHRDLKTANIMVGEFHEVYVMDWGISVIYETENRSEKKHEISGTPGYIPPEVLTDYKLTPAADQYALGMILLEIATMKPPVQGNANLNTVLMNTVKGTVINFEHRFKECNVPSELKAIIKKASALRPEDRYASVAELAADVRHYLTNEELTVVPDTFLKKIFRWMENNKVHTAVGAIIFVVLCASLLIYGLVRQLTMEREYHSRTSKLVRFHSQTKDMAYKIDSRLFQMAHILDSFAEKAEEILQLASSATSTDKRHLLYPYQAFLKGTKLPPGTFYSERYKQFISFEVGNYYLSPGLKERDARKELHKLESLIPYMKKYVKLAGLFSSNGTSLTVDTGQVFSQNSGHKKGKYLGVGQNSSENRNTHFFGTIPNNSPIVWIYLGLEDGLFINFPGNGIIGKDYNPRIRPWYTGAVKTKKIVWSSPYVDTAGMGVIASISKAIYKNNNLLGVASIDITFDYITNILMKDKTDKHKIICSYLIDKDANIILSSRVAPRMLNEAYAKKGKIRFPPFPYPDIKNYITKESSAQFEIRKQNKIILIDYSKLSILSWYFVRETELKNVLN